MLRRLSKNIAGQRQLGAQGNRIDTVGRPHLNVFRSLRNIYVEIVNDKTGAVLAEVSTLDKDLRPQIEHGNMIHAAKVAGEAIARQALEKGINNVVFDCAEYVYHGRVAALAAAAREAGLKF